MKLSQISQDRLLTCDPRLQQLVSAVSDVTNCAVLCGHRDEADQEHAFLIGTSKEQWPNSRHNSSPSEAVDLAPLPLSWEDIDSFRRLNEVVQQEAAKLGLEIEWGGDFKSIKDWDHWQLKRS